MSRPQRTEDGKRRGPDHGERALAVARRLRGARRPPAIMLHGVMPRSGTVYTGELLRLHPWVEAYPHELWETPFLRGAGHLRAHSDEFFHFHDRNRGKLGHDDLLLLSGSAFVALLHEGVDPKRTVLVKTPDVFEIERFPAVFPFERCLLLLRDGRDVVASTLRTWPERMSFEEAAARWAAATEGILRFVDADPDDPARWLVRYEDVVADPARFVREACSRFELDPALYPYDAIADLPVRGSSRLPLDSRVVWNPQPRPAGFATSGRWHDWSPERLETFDRLAGAAMRAAGYGD